jgi:tRNA/rRNA methyltransferase
MPRLNQLFNRARLTEEEVHILRGIARAAAGVAEDAGADTKRHPSLHKG